jgi:fucose permease
MLALLIIIYISFISLGLPDSLLGSAWPSMYGSLGVPLHYGGYVSMIIAGGTVVSSILSGKLIGRFGTGRLTVFSVFLTAAALTGFSFSHDFIALCICAVPLGLGAGSVDTALNNYVALHFKAKHMSWLHCFWGIGASAGPMVMAAFLMYRNSWNWGYRAIGIFQCCLVIVLFVSQPLWEKNKSKGAPGEQRRSVKYRELFHIAGVKQVLAAFFCYNTIEVISGFWGSSYLVTVRNIAPATAAQWVALYYTGITLGRFISGFLTVKLNDRRMIRLGQGLTACGIIALLLPFGAASLLPGFFIIGLGCAPIFPSLIHQTPENFGGEYSRFIIGLQMTSAYAGVTLMPPLFGRIAALTGFAIFPAFIALALAVKIIMTEMLNKKVACKKN